MGKASQRYEQRAREWDESGRPKPEVDAEDLMKLSCWMHSPGGKHDGVSERLKAYEQAVRCEVERRNPDWLDDLFDGVEFCRFCGQSWRTENCRICTYCSKAYPPCCPDKQGFVSLPNGNLLCPTCGEGELVG